MKYEFSKPSSYAANDLKRLRKEKGMTQKEMASFLGVSKKAVEAWEYGENPPSGPVRRLLEILEYGDVYNLPFTRGKEEESVRYVMDAAIQSRGSGRHWLRYLRKLFDGNKMTLTAKEIDAILESDELDHIQKVVLKRAVIEGTPTNRHVVGLNEKHHPTMLEEVIRRKSDD